MTCACLPGGFWLFLVHRGPGEAEADARSRRQSSMCRIQFHDCGTLVNCVPLSASYRGQVRAAAPAVAVRGAMFHTPDHGEDVSPLSASARSDERARRCGQRRVQLHLAERWRGGAPMPVARRECKCSKAQEPTARPFMRATGKRTDRMYG